MNRGATRLLVDLVRVPWDLVVSFLRDFLWASAVEGRLRTRGLPTGARVVALAAGSAVVAMLTSLALSERWRSLDATVLADGQVLRGTLVPSVLVPVTFALLAFGAALCVAAALRAGPAVSAAVGVTYVAVASFVHGSTPGSGVLHALAGGAIVVVAVALVAVRHVRPRPQLELVGALALVGLTFGEAHRALTDADVASGTELLSSQTNLLLANAVALSGPLVIAAGLGVVSAGASMAHWGLEFVDRRLGRRALLVGAVLLGAWRLRDVLVTELRAARSDGWGSTLQSVVGSLVLVVLVGAVAAWARAAAVPARCSDADATEQASRYALPVAVGLTAITVTSTVVALAVQGISPSLSEGQAADLQRWASSLIDGLGDLGGSVWWTILRAAVAGVVCVWLGRRGRHVAATFVGSIGIVLAHATLTDPDRPADAWRWSIEAVDLVVVVAICVLLVRWWLTRSLSSHRLAWTLYLLLLTALFRQGSFVADPVSTLLVFSGVAVVLVGLVWGFVTGLSWANEGSPAMPRQSRVNLLLGYQIFSIAILHWYVVSHDLDKVDLLTSVQPGIGSALLGQPLLFTLVAGAIAAALADEPVPVDADADAESESESESEPESEPEPDRGRAGRAAVDP